MRSIVAYGYEGIFIANVLWYRESYLIVFLITSSFSGTGLYGNNELKMFEKELRLKMPKMVPVPYFTHLHRPHDYRVLD